METIKADSILFESIESNNLLNIPEFPKPFEITKYVCVSSCFSWCLVYMLFTMAHIYMQQFVYIIQYCL